MSEHNAHDDQSQLQEAERVRKIKQEAHYAEARADVEAGMNRELAIRKHGICAVLKAEGKRVSAEAARGFVSDSRFDRGSDRVIPRTNRAQTRKNRA